MLKDYSKALPCWWFFFFVLDGISIILFGTEGAGFLL